MASRTPMVTNHLHKMFRCRIRKATECNNTARINWDKTWNQFLRVSQTVCYWDKQQSACSNIIKASIDVEPKIRTAEENLISLPNRKTIVSVCTTNVISYVCLFVTRNHLLQQCIILDILFGIVTENVYFACLFLESIKC